MLEIQDHLDESNLSDVIKSESATADVCLPKLTFASMCVYASE